MAASDEAVNLNPEGRISSFGGVLPFFSWRIYMRLNYKDMKENVRKMAIALMIAGLAGYILESVGLINTSIIVAIGLTLWIFGLVERDAMEEE